MPVDVEHQVQLGMAGLNLRDSALEVGVTGLVDTMNWRLDQFGSLVKRLGYTNFSPSLGAAGVLEMATFQPSAGASWVVSMDTQGNFVRSNGSTGTTGIVAGLSTSAVPSFAQMLDKIYFSNGTDAVYQYDGTTATAITGVNDVQTVTITGTPTGGTFTLSFGGATTAPIAYNAAAAAVQTALQALSSIGPGNVTCTGGALPGTGVICTFVNQMAFTFETLMTSADAFTGGSSPASHVAHTTPGRGDAPKGKYLTVWRNRLWIAGVTATPNRVYWSGIGDPTVWNTLNFVDILGPRGDQITSLHPSPNFGTSFDGGDGVLVYKTRSLHRIWDDTDNTFVSAGIGGANVLIDGSVGTVSHRTVHTLNGRVYAVAKNGIYSTDGHSPQTLESDQLGSLVPKNLTQANIGTLVATTWQGSYLLACQPPGSAFNNLVLELYSTLGRVGTHPIMAIGMPVQAWAIWPDATGDQLIFQQSSTTIPGGVSYDDRGSARRAFVGGADFYQGNNLYAIAATAHSGVTLFGVDRVKHLRRVRMIGRGALTIGVLPDYETGQGDQQQFLVSASASPPLWNQNNWNQQNWAGAGDSGVLPVNGYYGTRGRWFAFYLQESSQAVGQSSGALGITPTQEGGAVLHQMLCTLTPLSGEV